MRHDKLHDCTVSIISLCQISGVVVCGKAASDDIVPYNCTIIVAARRINVHHIDATKKRLLKRISTATRLRQEVCTHINDPDSVVLDQRARRAENDDST